ncbi:MAG: hypothetical protein ABI243_10455 [Lapillicoccus sp.]
MIPTLRQLRHAAVVLTAVAGLTALAACRGRPDRGAAHAGG